VPTGANKKSAKGHQTVIVARGDFATVEAQQMVVAVGQNPTVLDVLPRQREPWRQLGCSLESTAEHHIFTS
jgi:pyruvate/2-oxoglutarate dehydrogenase complex dihydrolipoamide dehydrogenase (E3) component